MGTGVGFANFVFKRLLAAEDFSTRFLDFLLDNFRELTIRVFATNGVFDTKIVVSGSANPNEIVLTQGAPGDFRGTDGLGNIIGLAESGSEDEDVGQIKTLAIENTNTISYYVSLQYTTVPSGIQINPRNGVPFFSEMVQAIGVKATPNAVVDNGGTLTFTIDSACESNHSHAGRTAIVYKIAPVKGATTEATAIETCIVSWTGLNNKITTTGTFGQSAPSTTPADYAVILLGPSVRKADTRDTDGHIYLATVTGSGSGNPIVTTNNDDQVLIDQSLSSLTTYPGGSNWADGTANPSTTIINQISKIITDLTSTTGARGAGKLTAPARSNWADATTNPAARVDEAIEKIITDLASVIGNRGAGKLTAPARSAWPDGITNPAVRVDEALEKIITDLSSLTGEGGAGKINVPARSAWYDGTTNPAARLSQAGEKIITDLISTSGNRGAHKITSQITKAWHDTTTFTAGSIHEQLEAIVQNLGIDVAGSDRVASNLLTHGAIGSTPSGEFALDLGSIKDQLQQLVNENALARQVALYAARNYNVRITILASAYIIHDFCKETSSDTSYYYYAVGDDESGTVSPIRYVEGSIGGTWADGPAFTGSPTRIQRIAHGTDVDVVCLIGYDAAGAWLESTPENMLGSFSTVTAVGKTDLLGEAIIYHSPTGNWYAGFYQKVANTGNPIQKATAPTVGFNITDLTRPSTLRAIYAFAYDSFNVVAVGIDTSNKGMVCHSNDGGETWTNVSPTTPPDGALRDVVWDEYRQRFWALGSNGTLLYSNSTGTTWAEKTNGVDEEFRSIAVDPDTGILIFSGANGVDRIGVSLNGVRYDEISLGDNIYWGDPEKAHFIDGRFIIASTNDLLIGGTLRGGIKEYINMGAG